LFTKCFIVCARGKRVWGQEKKGSEPKKKMRNARKGESEGRKKAGLWLEMVKKTDKLYSKDGWISCQSSGPSKASSREKGRAGGRGKRE